VLLLPRVLPHSFTKIKISHTQCHWDNPTTFNIFPTCFGPVHLHNCDAGQYNAKRSNKGLHVWFMRQVHSLGFQLKAQYTVLNMMSFIFPIEYCEIYIVKDIGSSHVLYLLTFTSLVVKSDCRKRGKSTSRHKRGKGGVRLTMLVTFQV
jgi:hypothetical protein